MIIGSDFEIASTSGASFGAVNPYLLDSIVRLSDVFEVTASSDIYDDKNITLWSVGAPVSRTLYERVHGQRLRHPLEASLEIGDGVSMSSAIRDCLALIERHQALKALAGRRAVLDMLNGLRSMALPEPLRLLLTSARELRPRDYEGSLAAMIVSAGLARHAGFSERDAGHLMLAALVADIGEMYINPELLDGTRELRHWEWQTIAWHPCVGEEFLKEFTRFPAAVTDGVLRHHERFDGHGYPFQVRGERLGVTHTMLGAADTVAAIVMRGGAGLADRVSVALHILPGEFPPPVVRLVTNMLEDLDETQPYRRSGEIAECILPELERLRAAKHEAMNLMEDEHGLAVNNAAEMALNLLLRIDQSLGAARVHDLLRRRTPEDDPTIVSMIRMIPDEIAWRLRHLARNVYLDAEQSGNPQDLAALANLLALLAPMPAAANRNLFRFDVRERHSAW